MRHKDSRWDLPGPRVESWEQAGIAVLMDIRDELKALNYLLHCNNFINLPHTLNRIAINTTKEKRVKK